MKRKVFFFSIILPLVATANIAGVSLMSGCSSIKGYYDRNVVRKFTSDGANGVYSQLPRVNYAFNNLFSGTRNYNHGNYMIVIGAIGDPSNNRLVSDPGSDTTNCEMKSGDGRWKNTSQMLTSLGNVRDKDLKSIKIDLLIYQATLNEQVGNHKLDGLVNSSDYTNMKNYQLPSGGSGQQIDTLINNPFLRYSDDKTFIKKEYRNKYVRNDPDAVTYRNLINFIRNLHVISSVIENQPIVVMSRWDNSKKQIETRIKQYSTNDVTSLTSHDINDFFGSKNG